MTSVRGDATDSPGEDQEIDAVRQRNAAGDVAGLVRVASGSRTALARVLALHYLDRLGAREARPDVEQLLLNDADTDVRAAAAKALGAVGTRESMSALTVALGHGPEQVSMWAAQSLGRVGDASVLPVLAAYAERATSWNGRCAALGALTALGKGTSPVVGRLIDQEPSVIRRWRLRRAVNREVRLG